MLPLILLLSCNGPDDTEPVDTGEPPLEHLFSFAILADPHIAGDIGHEERLAAAVEWVNTAAAADKIEIVVVVGDIGWDEQLPVAKALLDELDMPYVPILGDNEVHFGDAKAFDDVFTPQYALLATEFENFERGAIEVYNPVHNKDSWMNNLSFDFRGLHWVGLDWISRSDNSVLGEFAELNNFEGGSYPFFEHELATLDAGPDENVLLFSHHPMNLGLFNLEQLSQLTGVTNMVSDRVAGAYAGHLHIDFEESVLDGGYEVFITDATWDDDNRVRLVEVWGNGLRFEYTQELVTVQ